MGLKLMGRLFGYMLKVVYTMGKMEMSRVMAFSCFLLINPVFNIVINSYQHGKFGGVATLPLRSARALDD
jgi:hypothetical protein